MTGEQVIKNVLLDAQPTKGFVTSEQVAALALFLCSTMPHRSRAPTCPSTEAGATYCFLSIWRF
jgi:hypothetical protein